MKEFKFNKAQEAWLQDLEKTRAKQGAGSLHDSAGWCCLGRACKVLGASVHRESDEYIGIDWVEYWDGEGDRLSKKMIAKLHMRDSMGYIEGNDRYPELRGYHCLSHINDSLGWSFKQIAKWIRKNPEAVFTNGRK